MLINELKSERVLIFFVLCVLAAQIPHAQGVWYHASAQTLAFDWSHLWGWLCAWLFAFGLEFSTLMQVIRGRHLLSYLFAFISVCINLSYFQLVNGVSITALPTRYWLLSIILPVAIASYSHLCAALVNEVPVAAAGWPLRSRLQAHWARWRRRGEADTPADSTTAHLLDKQPQRESTVDERASAVIAAVQNGATSVYAIARITEINASTLRRKNRRGTYTGLIERLIQAGLLAEEDGAIVPVQ